MRPTLDTPRTRGGPRPWLLPAALLLAGAGGCGERPTEPPDPGPDPSALPCPEGRVELAVGEAASLPPDRDCLQLAAGGGRYALAFYDTSLLEAARSGPEPVRAAADSFELTLRSPAAPGAAVAAGEAVGTHAAGTAEPGAGARDGATGPDAFLSTAGTCDSDDPDPILCREAPWRVGDVFGMPQGGGEELDLAPIPTEVVSVHGRLVFAMSRRQVEDRGEVLRGELDRLAPVLRDLVVTPLEAGFGTAHPVTSEGSGQLLVNVRDAAFFIPSGAVSAVGGPDGLRTWLVVRLDAGSSDFFGLLAHELTHAWQFQYRWERRPDPATPMGSAPRWGTEGGAALLAQEALRRRAGVALDANLEARLEDESLPPEVRAYLGSLRFSSGNLPRGYEDTAGFLRDLLLRATSVRHAPGTVLAALLRGAVEGWHGWDFSGLRYAGGGLVDRMQGLVGPGWDPVEAVLTYALSVAADDRLESDRFRYPPIRDAWRRDLASSFEALGGLLLGGPTVRARAPAGSTGYLYIRDPGSGGAVFLESGTEPTRWMVLRLE